MYRFIIMWINLFYCYRNDSFVDELLKNGVRSKRADDREKKNIFRKETERVCMCVVDLIEKYIHYPDNNDGVDDDDKPEMVYRNQFIVKMGKFI